MEIPYKVTPRKDTGLTNSKIAIWLFLASEVMLFGGLFSGYIFLRVYADFPWPERTLPIMPGLINTAILIASSITVVFAWAQLKLGNWNKFRMYMGTTILCAAVFLGLKGVEYKAKFEHQGVRLDDYTILEGHNHKVKYDSHGHMFHVDKEGNVIPHDGHEPHGTLSEKVQSRRLLIDAKEITFDLSSYNKGYVENLFTQAKKHEAALKLSEDVFEQTSTFADNVSYFTGKGVDLAKFDQSKIVEAVNKLLFDKDTKKLVIGGVEFSKDEVQSLMLTKIGVKGDKLTLEILAAAKRAFVKARGINKEARTQETRRLWAVAKQENPDLPSWKQADNVKLDTALINDDLVKQTSTLVAKVAPHCVFHFKRTEVQNHGGSAMTTKDGTRLTGKYIDSPFEIAVDAVDFTFLVQQARFVGIDPDDAIEKSWILQKSPELKAAWEAHKAFVKHENHEFYEQALKKTNGDEAKAKEIARFIPDVERYRMTWKDIIRYGSKGSDKEIDLGWAAGFAGADHYNKDWNKYFYDVKIPQDKIAFESRFTPRWNNYYAIYFTITALHGLHIIGGAYVLGYYMFCPNLFRTNRTHLANRVEVAGLFWHFVDLVWIFLFPILYLM